MPPPVRGFADLHSHPMAHLGFGKKVLAGAPWDEGGYARALARCDGQGQPHQVMDDVLGAVIRYFSEPHSGACGFDTFDNWPTHQTVYHQQMYIDWLKRAWAHGLRVLCGHVVNNELLARRMGAARFSEFNMLDQQLKGLDAFVEYANRVCDDAQVPRWLGLARSPADARALIANGQLAIVVGIEIDTLESLVRHTTNDEPTHPDNVPSVPTQSLKQQPLTSPEVDQLLDLLVQQGVSMVTPMHLADNSFGGAAIYDATFDVLNRWLRGHWYAVRQEPGIAFQLKEDLRVWAMRKVVGIESPQYGKHGWHAGHANARGLTPLGREFLVGAMKRGLLIDVDHMCTTMTDQVLALMDGYAYPALSSHSSFRALAYGRTEIDDRLAWSHEANKTPEQVDLILKHGGLVAPITNQHHVKPHGPVTNHQHGTSRTWAQSFLYAVDQVKRLGKGGVALGTDFNGLAQQPGPRYPDNAPLDAEAVRYEDALSPTFFSGRQLSRLHLPHRVRPFDFNRDGLANYGLVPDFIEDLRRIGTPAPAIDTLFDSAEAFLQCWETCKARAPGIT